MGLIKRYFVCTFNELNIMERRKELYHLGSLILGNCIECFVIEAQFYVFG